MNYDPNLTNSGRRAAQTVRLTFGLWDYRLTATVTVKGNSRGLSTIGEAVEVFYDRLGVNSYGDSKSISMTAPNEDVLICDEADSDDPDWPKDMLIAAEITEITGIQKEGEKS